MSKALKTLVLNHAHMPISIIPVERAFAIYFKGNAEILYEYDEVFKTIKRPYYKKPSVIKTATRYQLQYYRVALTRSNVFKRDDYECVYCGKSGNKSSLTLDHVIPRSKGGKDSWDNLVTACKKCNSEKADLEVEEWGKENPKPFKPHYLMMITKSIGFREIPTEWKPFLFL